VLRTRQLNVVRYQFCKKLANKFVSPNCMNSFWDLELGTVDLLSLCGESGGGGRWGGYILGNQFKWMKTGVRPILV